MKKKFLLFTAVAGLATVGLVSCGSEDASSTASSNATGLSTAASSNATGLSTAASSNATGLSTAASSNATGLSTAASSNATGLSTGDSSAAGDDDFVSYTFEKAPEAPQYTTDNGSLDILLNYSGNGGISRAAGQGSTDDPITDEQITEGALLPTWRAFASYTRSTFRDASSYAQSKDDTVWDAVAAGDKIMSQTDDKQDVDLIYNSTSNFKKGVAKLKSLNAFLGLDAKGNEVEGAEVLMPNFKAWLKANPTMAKAIQISGNYYYTPYFDGYNDIERMFLMDTDMVKAVLDVESGWDTGTTNGGATPSGNVVKGGYYQPFVDATNNYASAQTVKVLVKGEVKEATIAKTENIIKSQNTALAGGVTGADLAQQFITYIKTAYKDMFDKGYYTNPSDVFISSAAAYNADDLIALMRVIKANPGLITGDPNAEIETFFPRAASSNRIENVYDLTQIWGIQGTDGENKNFYVAGDGKLHALETTKASYDALGYLSQIYDEGLILEDFYTNASGTASKTDDLDIYWKHTSATTGYGFMMYDYSASTTAANDIYEGVGTSPASRKGSFAGQSVQGLTAVLPPLTYWATGSEWVPTQAANDFTGKTLERYYESNRALKGNSWAIPTNSDNAKGAARLMDFIFSDLGILIQDYGPTNYWEQPMVELGDIISDGEYDPNAAYVCTSFVPGERNAIIHGKVKSGLEDSGVDFWTYMRNWLGSTHGIGHVRSKGINIQATNYYAQWGCKNVASAFGTDSVLKLAMVDKFADLTWDSSVPSGYTSAHKDSTNAYSAITGFWNADKFGKNEGWVNVVMSSYNADKTSIVVKDPDGGVKSYSQVLEQFSNFNTMALYTYANSVGAKYVPSYAQPQN